jgi:anhydro-N-acetylmuramic acid kinase
VVAFDTGPGNMVVDALVAIATGGRFTFDADGRMAARGRVIPDLLESLLEDPYFSRRPPKSTGRERFGAPYARHLWERGRAEGIAPEDLIATATALTAEALARAYRDFLPPVDEAILGGGGTRNPALRREIERRLSPVPVRTYREIGGDDDAKEAVAFALLADRTLQGLPGNLPRATGARGPALLGSITPPPSGT